MIDSVGGAKTQHHSAPASRAADVASRHSAEGRTAQGHPMSATVRPRGVSSVAVADPG